MLKSFPECKHFSSAENTFSFYGCKRNKNSGLKWCKKLATASNNSYSGQGFENTNSLGLSDTDSWVDLIVFTCGEAFQKCVEIGYNADGGYSVLIQVFKWLL